MKTPPLTRRGFLKTGFLTGSAFVFPTILPSRVLGADAPSRRITLGFIGMGGQGTGRNLRGFLACPETRVLALCDCKLSQTAEGKAIVDEHFGASDCAVYQDFRDVLARPDIDAIVISTPDHWHVPMSRLGLRAGKHVFCEKPTLTITEGRELVEEAARAGKVFQWGVEDRSMIKYWMMAGLARTGALGEVHTVHCELPLKPLYKREAPAPIPDDLDWNLWLGPAPLVEYTASVLHPQRWRQRVDYSGGSLTDWGTHLCDTAQIGIGMEQSGPVEVSGTCKPLPADSYVNAPYAYDLQFLYAGGVTIKVTNTGTSISFEGTRGWIKCEPFNGNLTASDMRIYREKGYEQDANYWPRPPGEHVDFVKAILHGTRPAIHPEAGHRFATMLHLGHMATRCEKPVAWDPQQEQFTRDAEEHQASIIHHREERDWENAG